MQKERVDHENPTNPWRFSAPTRSNPVLGVPFLGPTSGAPARNPATCDFEGHEVFDVFESAQDADEGEYAEGDEEQVDFSAEAYTCGHAGNPEADARDRDEPEGPGDFLVRMRGLLHHRGFGSPVDFHDDAFRFESRFRAFPDHRPDEAPTGDR